MPENVQGMPRRLRARRNASNANNFRSNSGPSASTRPRITSWGAAGFWVDASTVLRAANSHDTAALLATLVCVRAGATSAATGSMMVNAAPSPGLLLARMVPPILTIVCALAVGTLLGALNGAIQIRTGLPSFIITLATSLVYRGILTMNTSGFPVVVKFPASYAQLIAGKLFFGYRMSIVWFIVVAVLATLFLLRTRMGNWAFAIGQNPTAAKNLGVPVARTTVTLFAMSGFASGVAGVVVAVAAGNSGPGPGTLESPGRARKIITVGASTNQHFVGQPFTYPAGGGTTIGAAVGDFPALATASYDLFDTQSNGCTSVDPGASGKLAIIDRGVCTFSAKVRNAIAAGAIGVLVINNVAGDPTAMAKDGGGGDDLPAVMIGLNEGAALRASGETTASAVAVFQEFITTNKDILAGFSSQGPTIVDLAVKPDLTSVGVNVLSSITCVGKPDTCPGDGTGWAFFSGTSMSTPHIAGSAAVLLDLHPDWSPAQVKSALANRADLVVKDAKTGIHDIGPTAQGAGRENLSVAADATTWLDPVSASFGQVTVGHPTSLTITLSNPTGSDETFSVSKTKFTPSTFGGTVSSVYDAGILSAGDDRITVPDSVTVPANGSTTLTVTVNAGHSLDTVQGWINLDGPGSNDLHFAYYAVVGH